MGIQIIKVKAVAKVTHDVLRIETEKPANYKFEPGQATELAINKPDWVQKRDPSRLPLSPTKTISNLPLKHTLNTRGLPTNC